jgi:hypothetical protein
MSDGSETKHTTAVVSVSAEILGIRGLTDDDDVILEVCVEWQYGQDWIKSDDIVYI